jgi:hypothetical protein
MDRVIHLELVQSTTATETLIFQFFLLWSV